MFSPTTISYPTLSSQSQEYPITANMPKGVKSHSLPPPLGGSRLELSTLRSSRARSALAALETEGLLKLTCWAISLVLALLSSLLLKCSLGVDHQPNPPASPGWIEGLADSGAYGGQDARGRWRGPTCCLEAYVSGSEMRWFSEDSVAYLPPFCGSLFVRSKEQEWREK